MQDIDVRVILQILAHDSGMLSVEELSYRNTDVEEEKIRDRLHTLQDRGFVESLDADPEVTGFPNKFWVATDDAVQKLEDAGVYEEIRELSQADDALDRSDRLREIEEFRGRPELDSSL